MPQIAAQTEGETMTAQTTTPERVEYRTIFCGTCVDSATTLLVHPDTDKEYEVCGSCGEDETYRFFSTESDYHDALEHDAAEASWEAWQEDRRWED
jgi:hypothetical protein